MINNENVDHRNKLELISILLEFFNDKIGTIIESNNKSKNIIDE